MSCSHRNCPRGALRAGPRPGGRPLSGACQHTRAPRAQGLRGDARTIRRPFVLPTSPRICRAPQETTRPPSGRPPDACVPSARWSIMQRAQREHDSSRAHFPPGSARNEAGIDSSRLPPPTCSEQSLLKFRLLDVIVVLGARARLITFTQGDRKLVPRPDLVAEPLPL
jgi:hypothetical protein